MWNIHTCVTGSDITVFLSVWTSFKTFLAPSLSRMLTQVRGCCSQNKKIWTRWIDESISFTYYWSHSIARNFFYIVKSREKLINFEQIVVMTGPFFWYFTYHVVKTTVQIYNIHKYIITHWYSIICAYRKIFVRRTKYIFISVWQTSILINYDYNVHYFNLRRIHLSIRYTFLRIIFIKNCTNFFIFFFYLFLFIIKTFLCLEISSWFVNI